MFKKRNKDIKFKKYRYNGESRSKFQKKITELIKEIYPTYEILTEYPIGFNKLKLDIFIPRIGMAVEADGPQHGKFNKFFHLDINGFKRQKQNDNDKEIWCIKNNIKLIRVKKEVSKEELMNLIYDN